MPRATYHNTSGGFEANENQVMSDFLFDEFTWFADRPTLAQDYQGCLAFHAKNNCAWYRPTVGMLVSVPGLHPEERINGKK